VQELLDPQDNLKRCDLLLALGEALLAAGEPLQVVETIAPQAFALAEQLGDRQRASRTCQTALEAILRQRGPLGGTTPVYRRWAKEADHYAAPESADRVGADIAMSGVAYFEDRLRDAWELLRRAVGLAQRRGDAEGLYRAAARIMNLSWLPEYEMVRHSLAEELFLRGQAGVNSGTMGLFLHGGSRVFLAWGERNASQKRGPR
jgi:hypothetical protein